MCCSTLALFILGCGRCSDHHAQSSPSSTMSMPQGMQPSGDHRRAPHIVLLPSAGMGHLMPFLRLAVALSTRGCHVSLVATHPTVSSAEARHVSDFFAAFPRVCPLELHLPVLHPSGFTSSDPFFLRFEAIRRSAHLLPPLLADVSPPVSALVLDVSTASAYVPMASGMGIPAYVLFTSSAAMQSLCAYFPTYNATKTIAGVGDVDIPGVGRVPKSSLPMPLLDPGHLFTTQFVANGQTLPKADGILINTFEALEPAVLAALNGGKVVPELPPVVAIGPLLPLPTEGSGPASLAWLDEQPEGSVVYVSFGSRTAMSTEQIKELGSGLERSGCRFLWAVKSTVVDREEEEGLEALLDEGFLEKVKDRGLVVKGGWVEQEEILRHRAVGCFVSHCGWNSVTEAALNGVRVLAWPRLGDQRVNARVVAESGLGMWVEKWSTEVVKADEICECVRELMGDERLRASAARLREEAVAAVGIGGSSHGALTEFIDRLKA